MNRRQREARIFPSDGGPAARRYGYVVQPARELWTPGEDSEEDEAALRRPGLFEA